MGSLLIVGLGAAGFSAGCSSPFDTCQARRTCPSSLDDPAAGAGNAADSDAGGGKDSETQGKGGSGAQGEGGPAAGTGGAGGAAGAAPEPECERDGDCSDGLACNGVEACAAGVCQAGALACANPDTVNCEVHCTELNEGASCFVQAQDVDKDGYRSSACVAVPGSDCDDRNAVIHPGTSEICDGLDNDCNGKSDLSDGLPFSGTNQALVTTTHPLRNVRVSWLAKAGGYGVLWTDKGPSNDTPSYHFGSFDRHGTITNPGELIASFGPGSDAAAFPPAIAAGDAGFAIGWAVGSSLRWHAVLSNGGFDGGMTSAVVPGGHVSQPMTLQVPGKSWILAWLSDAADQGLMGAVLVPPATTLPSSRVVLVPQGLVSRAAMAATSEAVLLVYTDNTNAAWSSVRSAATLAVLPGGRQLDSASGDVGVASTSSGFGVAWSKGSDIVFESLKADGSARCGPTRLSISGAPPSVTQVVATGAGGFLINVSSGANTSIVPVSATCEFGSPVPLNFALHGAAIAGTAATGYAAVFIDLNGISQRRFGGLFCN